MYYITKIFLFILLVINFAFSLSNYNSGKVVDENNDGIPVVYIHDLNKDIWNITDSEGNYYLNSSFQNGDTLEFIHIGYHSKKVILNDENQRSIISLTPKTLQLSEVTYTKNIDRAVNNNEVQIVKSEYSSNSETKNFIRKLPGITIKSYGGSAGISSISIDGGTSTHTKILVDGFDLTNVQNGQMDISQLPAPFIKSIHYIAYDINKYGSGSIDGVVDFKPWTNSNSVTLSYGSFGHFSGNTKLNFYYKNTSADILIGYKKDEGNYSYSWKDNNYERKNNDFEQKYFSGRVSAILTERIYAKIFLLRTEQNRGVAGQKWSPNLVARRKDDLFTSAFTLGWNSKNGHGKFDLIYRNSDDDYFNPNINVNSFYENITTEGKLDQNYNFTKKIKLLGNLSLRNEVLKMNKINSHERILLKNTISILYKPMKIIKIKPTVNYEFSPDEFEKVSYSFGTTIFPKQKILESISLHYANLYRFPSFNDMYWEPGGNSELRTEKTDVFNCSSKFKLSKFTEMDINLFYKNSNDLIQWMPQQSYWQPENIAKTIRYGYKISFDWNYKPLNMIGKFHYDHLISKNRVEGNYYNKSLRYAPKNIVSFNIQWQPKKAYVNLQIDYTDEQISLYSYPNDVILEPYLIINSSFGYSLGIFKRSIIAVVSVENILNKEYETIHGYPEPSRSYKLTLTYNFKKKSKKL